MTQLLSILFFLGVFTGCVHLIAAMLGDNWSRIAAALEGRAIGEAKVVPARRSVKFVTFTPARTRHSSPLRVAA